MRQIEQPACPAEYAWMVPGAWAEDDHGFRCLISRGPHRSETGEWRVLNKSSLPVSCEYLKPASMDTDDDRIDALTAEVEHLRAALTAVGGVLAGAEEKAREVEWAERRKENIMDSGYKPIMIEAAPLLADAINQVLAIIQEAKGNV